MLMVVLDKLYFDNYNYCGGATMMSIEDFIDSSDVLSNGCWIVKNTALNVIFDGRRTYSIKALFKYFNKEYNGKVERFCKNSRCINPDHMWSPTKEQKFWSNIYIGNPKECWEWKSLSGTKHYPTTHFDGESWIASRLTYKLTLGDIPDEMCVCHHCDNPPCCNPDHLFLGTSQDNMNDRERKERNILPHSKGENHGMSKLTEKEVKEIRELYKTKNYTYRFLAELYNVSFSNIRKIIKRWTWEWLE